MYSTLLTIALFVAPAIQGVFAEFAISTPDLVQCQDAKISWEPTKAPYNLIVVNPSDPCGDALVEVGDFTNTSISWKAALPAGTKVQLSLEDADGDEAWSGSITIGTSSDSSCIPASLKSAVASSSSIIATSAGTTLVVPPSSTAASTPSSASVSVAPVGAANAGTDPLSNSASSLRHLSAPIMALCAFGAAIVFCL